MRSARQTSRCRSENQRPGGLYPWQRLWLSGTRELGVFAFSVAVCFAAARMGCRCFAARARLRRGIENETVHAVEEVARELEHLLGGGGQLGGARCGLLHEFAHLVHRAD